MTSIFKFPVAGPVLVKRLHLEGDKPSDLTVHGGAEKAVYAYPSEHYEFWRQELPDVELAWGAFGENFTTQGLLEDTVRIGDWLRIGSAEFTVTQPRTPCFKLGIRFNRTDMVRRFLQSGRTGFYLSVSREGSVTPGDSIAVTTPSEASITVADIMRLYTDKSPNPDLLLRASRLPALSEGWRESFRNRLQEPNAGREE